MQVGSNENNFKKLTYDEVKHNEQVNGDLDNSISKSMNIRDANILNDKLEVYKEVANIKFEKSNTGEPISKEVSETIGIIDESGQTLTVDKYKPFIIKIFELYNNYEVFDVDIGRNGKTKLLRFEGNNKSEYITAACNSKHKYMQDILLSREAMESRDFSIPSNLCTKVLKIDDGNEIQYHLTNSFLVLSKGKIMDETAHKFYTKYFFKLKCNRLNKEGDYAQNDEFPSYFDNESNNFIRCIGTNLVYLASKLKLKEHLSITEYDKSAINFALRKLSMTNSVSNFIDNCDLKSKFVLSLVPANLADIAVVRAHITGRTLNDYVLRCFSNSNINISLNKDFRYGSSVIKRALTQQYIIPRQKSQKDLDLQYTIIMTPLRTLHVSQTIWPKITSGHINRFYTLYYTMMITPADCKLAISRVDPNQLSYDECAALMLLCLVFGSRVLVDMDISNIVSHIKSKLGITGHVSEAFDIFINSCDYNLVNVDIGYLDRTLCIYAYTSTQPVNFEGDMTKLSSNFMRGWETFCELMRLCSNKKTTKVHNSLVVFANLWEANKFNFMYSNVCTMKYASVYARRPDLINRYDDSIHYTVLSIPAIDILSVLTIEDIPPDEPFIVLNTNYSDLVGRQDTLLEQSLLNERLSMIEFILLIEPMYDHYLNLVIKNGVANTLCTLKIVKDLMILQLNRCYSSYDSDLFNKYVSKLISNTRLGTYTKAYLFPYRNPVLLPLLEFNVDVNAEDYVPLYVNRNELKPLFLRAYTTRGGEVGFYKAFNGHFLVYEDDKPDKIIPYINTDAYRQAISQEMYVAMYSPLKIKGVVSPDIKFIPFTDVTNLCKSISSKLDELDDNSFYNDVLTDMGVYQDVTFRKLSVYYITGMPDKYVQDVLYTLKPLIFKNTYLVPRRKDISLLKIYSFMDAFTANFVTPNTDINGSRLDFDFDPATDVDDVDEDELKDYIKEIKKKASYLKSLPDYLYLHMDKTLNLYDDTDFAMDGINIDGVHSIDVYTHDHSDSFD